MDDPDLQWPAWKFGMRREDLFTKLHDQYNTIPSSIQDPEAFHHDVYEISHTASTSDEFHSLLADRKQQRLRELNDSLESASLEIIANPSLIGTQQWQHAVQLFRTKSLDSLVRYFSSYLPEDHPWHSPFGQCKPTESPMAPSILDTAGTCTLTHEPRLITTQFSDSHLPPSPRSLTTYSDESSAVSPIDDTTHHTYDLHTLTPARTLSFSEPETDIMAFSGMLSNDHDDDASQSDEPDTPITSISDLSEIRSLPEHPHKDEADDERMLSESPSSSDEATTDDDAFEVISDDQETPTPRSAFTDSYDDHQSTSSSSSRHVADTCSSLYTHVLQEYVRSSRKSRRDGSPGLSAGRRSPEQSRVAKSDPVRIRPKGRRRV